MNVGYWYVWAALTPVVLFLARRFPFGRGVWLRSLPVHLVGVCVVTLAHIGAYEGVRLWLMRAFWTGPPLSAYEELGLLSFVARGQRVLLYSYDRTLRVPDGVELIDANEVLPADRIHEFIHPNGETSPTLHANLFRYEALRRFGGWYCDLDIVLVGDTPPDADVYLAREDDTFVNNAVLRFPPNAPLMVAASQAARELMTSAEWGASGPKLLTRLIAELGLSDLVQPWTAAYPVRPTEVAKLFLPEHRDELEDRAAGADFVHLWNQVWRRVRLPKDLGPPEGSFLDSLFRSFGIHVAPGARMSPRAVASWFGDFNFTADARRLVGETSGLAELAQALEQVRSGRNSDQRLADLAAALHEARWERDELLKSTSWRATAPSCGPPSIESRRESSAHRRVGFWRA
jgi:hypothetical protein